jgi:hypothetical protein
MISKEIKKFRRVSSPQNLYFWPKVTNIGQYGNMGRNVVLLPNNARLINEVLSSFSAIIILAFDAGGYDIAGAASFHSFTRQSILNVLSSEIDQKDEQRQIYFPISLAKSIKVSNDDPLGGWKVRLCDDNLQQLLISHDEEKSAGKQQSPKSIGFFKRLLYRFLKGGKLFLAQLLIFLIPIAVVQPSVILPVCIITGVLMLSLILLWELFPGRGVFKGLFNAVLVGLIVYFGRNVLSSIWDLRLLWQLIVAITSSVWLSIVFLGVRWTQ